MGILESFQETAPAAEEMKEDRSLAQEFLRKAPWETSNWSGATLAELGPLMMRYLENDSTNKLDYRDLPGKRRIISRDLLPLPLPEWSVEDKSASGETWNSHSWLRPVVKK